MKRHVPVFNILVKTFAAKCLLLPTFVLQCLLGWSTQTEVQLPVFFHFNEWIHNRRTYSSICIGPFNSEVSSNCHFDLHSNSFKMDCFKCYPKGCRSINNFVNLPTIHFKIDGKENFNRLMKTNGTLFVDIEVKCTWLKRNQFIEWYISWCDHNGWPSDRKLQCPDTLTTKTTMGTTFTNPMNRKTTSSTQRPMTSFSNLSRSSPDTRPSWMTSSSTEFPVTSYSNFTLSPPVTHLTWTPLVYRQQNNSITDIGEQSKKKDDTILWISLGAAALVILTAFIILFCQRAKIAKFLRKNGNPDIVDDAFYYRDMSMKRRENQHAPDVVTYENIIPNSCPEEVIYTELDLSAQHNFNPENAAAGTNSTLLEQKRDIKSYVDSVIYAELQKC